MNIDALDNPISNSDSATSEPVILVENVGKIFCRDLKRSLVFGAIDCMRDLVPGYKGRQPGPDGEIALRKDEFWANKGISFELGQGDCLGLIGHNGAGKTTLLRMLNGLIKPDEGFIRIRGRIGALIALGAGFNPILSGRENIYVNGSILGMNKAQIDSKFEEILEFADIGKFIDAPVQSYSSGMRVRLGFAVASTLDNEILIVDEVLAVGDFTFKQKCLQRIMAYRDRGGCILFVSHNLNQIQMVCNKGIYMSGGRMLYSGEVEEASNRYFEDIQKKEAQTRLAKVSATHTPPEEAFIIESAEISCAPGGDEPPKSNEPAFVTVKILAHRPIEKAFIRLVFMNKEQALRISTVTSEAKGRYFAVEKGHNEFVIPITKLPLVSENYSFRTALFDDKLKAIVARKGFDDQPTFFRVAAQSLKQVNIQNQFGDIVTMDIEK